MNSPARRGGTAAVQKRDDRLRDLNESAGRYRRQLAACAPFPDREKQTNFTTRLLASYATTLQRSPKLSECTNESLVSCLLQLAQLGLVPDGVLGQAHIVPFRKDAQIIVGYRGLVTLVSRSGLVASLHAACACEGDEFDYDEGSAFFVKHKRGQQRGEVMYAYAYAVGLNGKATPPRVHERAKLEEIKKRWMSKPGSAWAAPQNFEAMCEKTMVRQLVKTLPQSAMDETQTIAIERMHVAANLDERAEMSVEQELPGVSKDGE